MKFALLRYTELLLRIPPISVSSTMSNLQVLQARTDKEALNAMQEHNMKAALLKAAEGTHYTVNWDISYRTDGVHMYTEFYILTRERLAELLDGAFLMGRRDAGNLV